MKAAATLRVLTLALMALVWITLVGAVVENEFYSTFGGVNQELVYGTAQLTHSPGKKTTAITGTTYVCVRASCTLCGVERVCITHCGVFMCFGFLLSCTHIHTHPHTHRTSWGVGASNGFVALIDETGALVNSNGYSAGTVFFTAIMELSVDG
jgi:hypothetical protein